MKRKSNEKGRTWHEERETEGAKKKVKRSI